uniref:Putative ovule protein n=1 Tax=Solanum chacoense TaxID=4108 RepID=A0A0V0I984_SOLCH
MAVCNTYFDSFSCILGCIPDVCSPLQTSNTCIIALDLYITVLSCILVYTAVYIMYTALFWVFWGAENLVPASCTSYSAMHTR